MDVNDCIKFANENPVCFLSTLEGDQPRVRAMLFWFADRTGFYFQSGTVKELISQLKKNPKAEICFYKPDPSAGIMLRVAGQVDLLDDLELKRKACAERPFLKSMGITPESPLLAICRISRGEAYFWTMQTNLAPKQKIAF